MGQEGQLGHGENMAFLSAPCLLRSSLLSSQVLQIDAGDSYSAAVTADGGLFMWGRNCHVMETGRPDSQRAWSPRKISLGDREVCAVSCGTWHAVALTTPRAERSSGNKESDFRETGALFKEDSNSPQLMELEPRENSKRTPPAGGAGEPVNHGGVVLRRRLTNAPFDDMDKTDLLGARRSDGTEEPPGNGRSSITPRGDGCTATGPRGVGFRGSRAVSCPRPDRLSLPCGPGTLPELHGKRPPRRKVPAPNGGQLPSRELWGCGSSSSVSPSSKDLQQSPVSGSLPACVLPLSPGLQGQQSGPRRTRHLSPLSPHPRPSSSSSSSSSFTLRQPLPVGPAKPIRKQATYSSGMAWKDVSMSANPVLSHKSAAAASGQKSSQEQ
ncbi:hypothetical protein AAFF_G00024580 [Aldrovandia affinis]|uniref:Uncharacterized protein n=1 Tax=Aldrovandia affinis TaxID=143900 RepID=A0AAD7T5X9_9TELE|nr:hypothetical protein AAFF_G00024580 [Aldrovandia affinis]